MSTGASKAFAFAGLGAIQGVAAWSAYAIGEFLCSSVLFRFLRPYARFTTWHWELTAVLLVTYLVVGMLAGALAGIGVYFFSRRSRGLNSGDQGTVLEGAATFTVILAFAANVLAYRAEGHPGTVALLLVSAAMLAILAATIRSSDWSKRFGLLPNPWIAAAVVLGIGQELSLLQVQDLATQLGVNTWLVFGVSLGLFLAFIAAAVWIGRKLQLNRDRWLLTLPSRAAVTLVAALLLFSLVSSYRSSGEIYTQAAKSDQPQTGSRPNVVLIVMDTVQADHLSIYGYPLDTTPNLKKLALDSTIYRHTIAASDITLTSHASLFTGMYPSWHGAYCRPEATYGAALSKQYPTMTELLSAQGYHTMGVAANLYLRADFGLQRGFDVFEIPRPVPVLAVENWYLVRRGIRRILTMVRDTAQFDRLYSRGEEINREFFTVMRSADTTRAPLFVFLNYMDAHFPYIPPAPFDRRFPGRDPLLLPDDISLTHQKVSLGAPMPERELHHSLALYDGGIAYEDARIGEVMEFLKQRNLFDNSMIIVASDHGEAFGERNLVEHGNSPYQNLLHVALMIKYPKGGRTGVVDGPVSLIDVLPTVLSVTGRPAPAGLQGKNLLEALGQDRDVFSETFPCPVLHAPACPNGCTARVMVSWPNKLISSSNGKLELYDLETDSNEHLDRISRSSDLSRELGLRLATWVKTLPVQKSQPLTLDPEALQRLKSLGYVQGTQ